MAIIYSYPYVNTVNNSDTLVISVSDTTADNGFLTKSLTADDLASYVTARVNLNFLGDAGTGVVNLDTQNLTISGTLNEIETAASSQTLQIGLPDSVTITNNLTIGGDFVGGRGAFGSDLFVGSDLTVTGLTETTTLQVNSTSSMGGALNMTLNNINNVANPVAPQDAATKQYVDTAVTGLLEFKGTFNAATGQIVSGTNAGAYIYNCPGGGGTRVAIAIGDYYIVTNQGGQFYCSGDLLQVGDSIVATQDAGADSSTINDWGILEGDNVEGTGIANTIPLWTDSQVLGNSIITQSSGPTKITVAGSADVDVNLTVSGDAGVVGTFSGNNIDISGLARFLANSEFSGNVTILNNSNQFICGATSFFNNDVSILPSFAGPTPNLIVNGGNIDVSNAGRVIQMLDPVNPQDAATKAYVDAGNVGQVTGTGTTQTLPIWSDGPAGVLSDSSIYQVLDGGGNVREVNILTTSGNSSKLLFNGAGSKFIMERGDGTGVFFFSGDNTGFYVNNFQMQGTLAVGRNQQSTAVTLDVGDPTDTRPAAWFRNGVVISNNPAGVQVDNTSMVIGAGNNDNVSGSDHCLIVGSGNQITSNSDQSVAFGQGNNITDSTDAFAVGNSNTVSSSQRTLVLGYNNSVDSASSFIAGGENTVNNGDTNIVIGYNNSSSGSNNFAIGNVISSLNNGMVLGFRNNASQYPSTDINNGLSEVKFVVATGASNTTNSNALLITAGGKNGGNPAVPQIPRVILPTVVNFNFADDTAAAAGGIPVGGLYHNAGALRIRLV